jgi:hypothetical protein
VRVLGVNVRAVAAVEADGLENREGGRGCEYIPRPQHAVVGEGLFRRRLGQRIEQHTPSRVIRNAEW